MKNILVPFSDDDEAKAAAECVAIIAKERGGLIEGLFANQPPQVVVTEMVPATYINMMDEQRRADGEAARTRFEAVMAAADIPMNGAMNEPMEGAAADAVAASWVEMDGREDAIVADHGRVFDLIAVGRRTGRTVSDWNVTLEAAIFESGRPVLLTPPQAPKTLGRRVVIAWNGSTETAHAIAVAMPFLLAADEVNVITIEGATVPGPTGEEVARKLCRHGITARAMTDTPTGRTVGEAILECAAGVNADLMIKGAYTHSRLRQLIFGGLTRHIIQHASLPVLLAH